MADQPIPDASSAPTQDECSMAFLAHLLQVFTGFVGPLVIFCIRQNSRFVKFHALQSLVWQACYMVFFFTGFIVFFIFLFVSISHDVSHHTPNAPPIIFLLFPVLWLFAMGGWITNLILGIVFGLKAQRGEWAAYPVIGKWCLFKSSTIGQSASSS
jgi:uncharacterized Tic20 family protein